MLSCDRARVCTLACQSSETWLAHGNGKQWSDVRLGCANHMRQGPAADVDFVRTHGFYSNAASSSTILKLERETREKKNHTHRGTVQSVRWATCFSPHDIVLFLRLVVLFTRALCMCVKICVWSRSQMYTCTLSLVFSSREPVDVVCQRKKRFHNTNFSWTNRLFFSLSSVG